MLASRVRQSISGAGPTAFTLIDDAAVTLSRTIVTAYGSGASRAGVFTIVDTAAGQWAVVEGYATAGSPDSFTVTRTLRNSLGTASNVTWGGGTKTIFAGECADLLALLCQCPTTGGTATAYTVAYTPTPVGLVTACVLRFVVHATCGDNPTLAVNGLAAGPLMKADGTRALKAYDLVVGAVVEALYEPAAGRYRVLTVTQTPAFSLWRSGNQTVAANLTTIITFDTKAFDTEGWADVTGFIGRVTPRDPGRYCFNASCNFAQCSAATYAALDLYLNGAMVHRLAAAAAPSTDRLTLSGSAVIQLNGATDYVDVRVWHNDVASRPIQGGSAAQYLYFHGFKV